MELTKEQVEKLKTMKSEEEIKDFLAHERVELSPEDLEAISGGGLLDILVDTIGDALGDVIDAFKDALS